MTNIIADNAEIEKELQTVEKLVVEGGGGFHSNLIICSRDGDLCIETTEPMADGKEIIRLSRDVLLPSDQYIFGAKNGEFTIEFLKHSTFSTIQKKLAETMVKLYNLTGKVESYKEASFLLSIINSHFNIRGINVYMFCH